MIIPVLMMLGGQLCASYEFQAQYDKVFDGIDNPYPGADFKITVSRLSGDGRILAFAGWVENPNPDPGSTALERYIVIMSFDGTEARWIDSPVNPDATNPDGTQIKVMDIAISHYGAKIFFISEYRQKRIYLIQDGHPDPLEILNTDDYEYFALTTNTILRTTYDGNFVYFLEGKIGGASDIDIWRIDSFGLKDPELILDDAAVSTNGGVGRMVKDFDVSHSGYYLTFMLWGDSLSGTRNEVFTMTGDAVSTIRKLTNEDTTKYLLKLSDDGSTIVFGNGFPVSEWVGMDFDGTNRNVIGQMGYNIAGPTITANGDTVFYSDTKAAGGRIAASNGRGHYPLFPARKAIYLAATYDPEISADSSRVSFRNSVYTLYAGKLNLPTAFSNAPVIETIQLDPPFIDMNDTEGKILLTSRITDPQDTPVMSDIERTSLDHLLKGDFAGYSELPVWFLYPPKDGGADPDEEADDNIFTSISRTTGYDPDIDHFSCNRIWRTHVLCQFTAYSYRRHCSE